MTGDRVRTVLRGVGQTLITLGVVVLLFCAYELYFTNLYTDKQQSQLGKSITDTWQAPPPKPGSKLASAIPGQGIAILRIPRIGIVGPPRTKGHAWVVVEGVSHDNLKNGPGHYPGTAIPGAIGNMVISGHRTTYGAPFNRVDELRRGDAIVLETRDTWFTYRVTSEQIVAPSAVEVTYAVPGQRDAVPTKKLLTLTTCNPKYSAKQRLIVHAILESALPKADGDPPALTSGA
ncbi:MAG: sortase family protein [Frankiales bacterium]|nr:sortase family protein [Frankiales bacterium]